MAGPAGPASDHRYNTSAKGRARWRRYEQTHRDLRRTWGTSEQRRESNRRYDRSPAGRARNLAAVMRYQAKRREA